MAIRYGLIGSGMMGQEHIRNLNLFDGITVSAVAEPDEHMRKLSVQTSGGTAKLFTDYREMLSANICDAYFILSPNDTHYAIMLDVLGTQKPILSEKPLCTTSAECHNLIAKAAEESACTGLSVTLEG